MSFCIIPQRYVAVFFCWNCRNFIPQFANNKVLFQCCFLGEFDAILHHRCWSFVKKFLNLLSLWCSLRVDIADIESVFAFVLIILIFTMNINCQIIEYAMLNIAIVIFIISVIISYFCENEIIAHIVDIAEIFSILLLVYQIWLIQLFLIN